MVNRKSWEEFRETGLLWFINTILHTFGWSIVIEKKEDGIIEAYPARVKFRGFNEKSNTKGYIKVAKYLNDNINEILSEQLEEIE